MIGFMGCYAAINALKTARHIVRSEPEAKVLVLSLELCTLHMQETQDLEQILSFLLFADGCSASPGECGGIGLGAGQLSGRWDSGDEPPDHVAHSRGGVRHAALGQGSGRVVPGAARMWGQRSRVAENPLSIDLWAVHPGGRTILDSVEKGLESSRGGAGQFARCAGAVRQHVVGDGDVCSAEDHAAGGAGTARLCDVVWAGSDGRDHALSCGLSGEFGWR